MLARARTTNEIKINLRLTFGVLKDLKRDFFSGAAVSGTGGTSWGTWVTSSVGLGNLSGSIYNLSI